MAFPHPKSRKENSRNDHIPNNWRIVWKFFERTINVTNYRNSEEDVNPAKGRTFHVGLLLRLQIRVRGPGDYLSRVAK